MLDEKKEVITKDRKPQGKFKCKKAKTRKEIFPGKETTKAIFGKNDVNWYLNYPELAKDVANIAQNFIPGTFRELDLPSAQNILSTTAGVRINTIVTPGMCETTTDGFNLSMKSMWLEMHRKYRGIGTYQSSDLGAVIFAILALYAFLCEGERAYGLCANYSARNRLIPAGFEATVLWDFTSLRSSLADFRYNLNRIIKKASILCLPKGLAAFDDIIQLFSNVFKDRDSARAQYFAYVQKFIWTYDPTSINTGSAVMGVPVTTRWTDTSYLLKLESMVDALVQDDDVARICSDILAAFGDDVVRMLPLPEDYTISPLYHEVRNLQFHNMRCVRQEMGIASSLMQYANAYHTGTTGLTTPNQLFVYQEDNVIKFRPYYVSYTVGYYTSGVNNTPYSVVVSSDPTGNLVPNVFDVWKDQATQEDILELTRMSTTTFLLSLPVGSLLPGEQAISIRPIHGLYIIDSVDVILAEYDSTTHNLSFDFGVWASNYDNATSFNFAYSAIMAFDNAPLIFIYDNDAQLLDQNNVHILGAYDNLIFIKEQDMIEIHNVCVLSEFKYPTTVVK